MIKMRNNNEEDAICCECKNTQDKVLNMFDICIGKNIFTICDECNCKLFQKVLRAECQKDSRLKSQKDLAIIRARSKRRTRV